MPASEAIVPASTTPSSLSPEIAAFVAQTVQAAIQVHFAALPAQAVPTSADATAVSSAASQAAFSFGGIPGSLGSQTSAFMNSGTGFQSGTVSTQGRPLSFVVPSFVSTFAPPLLATASSSARAASSLSAGASLDVAHSTGNAVHVLADQSFVVGPGFSPVPPKLVNQIVAGKYVDLSELLAANLEHSKSEPQLLMDGRLVLTAPPKKHHRRVEDIASWMEAFTIFSQVLTSNFPHRWRDLTLYKPLILCTYRHFNGRVWHAYDQAFREHAAPQSLWTGPQ